MKFDFYSAEIDDNFDPETKLQKFESVEQARDARRQLAQHLSNLDSGRKLGRRISACGLGRCRSAACPRCLRDFRRWWGSQIASYMSRDPEGWYTVTITPADLFFNIGELNRFRWDLVKDRLRKQVARSDINRALILGGFDYAIQNFTDGRASKWRPHIYLLLTRTGKEERIARALREHYLGDEDTKKTVVVHEQKTEDRDLIRTATYSFKSYFYDREPTIDRRGNADTKKSPLSASQKAELAVLLDRQGFLGRMIRYGDDLSLPLLRTR